MAEDFEQFKTIRHFSAQINYSATASLSGCLSDGTQDVNFYYTYEPFSHNLTTWDTGERRDIPKGHHSNWELTVSFF